MARKGFNFYTSYWEQIKLLNKKQQLQIFKAICEVQFLEKNINDITFNDSILILVWTGIKHSILTSLNGYITKQQALGNHVIAPLTKGGVEDPCQQVQVQEEVKEKVESISKMYNGFLTLFNKTADRKFRVLDDKTKGQLNARIKEGFTDEDFITAITNCKKDSFHIDNTKYLTPEFITRADKLQKYLNVSTGKRIIKLQC